MSRADRSARADRSRPARPGRAAAAGPSGPTLCARIAPICDRSSGPEGSPARFSRGVFRRASPAQCPLDTSSKHSRRAPRTRPASHRRGTKE
ncbi:DUF6053 domain-containing protein [Lysobacter enzymogenes]|uniref:DUF6053 domain-containing protein n=1 Tax=Lysobacter enzymogenes TaxID=69 RepID=UPI003D18EA64